LSIKLSRLAHMRDFPEAVNTMRAIIQWCRGTEKPILGVGRRVPWDSSTLRLGAVSQCSAPRFVAKLGVWIV
jgi:hypothetical protein